MSEKKSLSNVTDPLVFLGRAAVLSMLACGVGLWILRWVFSRDLGVEFAPAFFLLKHLISFLVPALLFCILVVLLVASVAIFVVALFASHKLAGPLFRLQRVAGYLNRRILVGRIHLRAGDQGKPVAVCINEWVAGRKDRLTQLRSLVEELGASLRTCELAAGRRDPGEFSEGMELLRQQTRRLLDLKIDTDS